MTLFEQALCLAGAGLWGGIIVFLRVGAAMAILPALGEQSLPMQLRLGLSVMLTLSVAPVIVPQMVMPPADLPAFARALATESIAGTFMGLVLRLFILAIQTAGAIMAQSTSLSQIMGNAGADPLPAIGHVLTISALALLMVTGFHTKAVAYLILSYDLIPPLQFPDPAAVAEAGRLRVAQCFALAFTLAAPFVILSVLYNLTLGVINKAMPQLMVAFVGAPVITFGAIGLLFLCAPLVLQVWVQAVEAFLAQPFG